MKASGVVQNVLIFHLFLFSLKAFASSNVDAARRGQALRNSFQAVTFNPSLDANRTILNELLGSDSPQYQWPAFPRTWYQMDKAKTQEATTTFGGHLPLKAVSIGGKIGVTYSYGQKVSLVVVSSLRRSDSRPSRTISNEAEGMKQLTYFDHQTNQRYFNVTDEYPMVGFCAYEMSLKIGKTADGSLAFLGVGQAISLNEYQSETMILYSNFFQIQKGLSVQDHMKRRCEEHFLEKARPYVEEDFERIVMEYFTLYHPKNQCQLGGPSTENGDESCMNWHERSFNATIRKVTAPRCEQQMDGVSRCVLRSKKGFSCPLYLDRNNKITDVYQNYRDATLTDYAYTCDKGLVCSLDRHQLSFGSLVVWPGAATCK